VILLDTSVVSELTRPAPAAAVFAWAAAQPWGALHITAVTEAELRLGLALLPDGARRAALAAKVEQMIVEGLSGRVLPFDRAAAAHYAAFMAARRRAGRPVAMADAQIAAIARARGAAVLATRNTVDFEGCGVPLLDPWRGRA
jgi:predicted nucleic acid-binding protein